MLQMLSCAIISLCFLLFFLRLLKCKFLLCCWICWSGLGGSELDQSVHEYLTNRLAPTTQAAYRLSASHYLTFCSQFNLTPLPLTQVNITRFIAYLARMGVSYQSTRPYLAWVHFLQIASSFPDHGLDTLPQLYYVLWGVRRLSQTSSCPPRLLITPEILQLLYVQWSQASQEDGFHAAMLWAACCTVFYGFMRAVEFGAL